MRSKAQRMAERAAEAEKEAHRWKTIHQVGELQWSDERARWSRERDDMQTQIRQLSIDLEVARAAVIAAHIEANHIETNP